jgi:hypothetical protein
MAMTNTNQNPAPSATVLSAPAKAVLEAADKLKVEAKAQEDKLRAEALKGNQLDVDQVARDLVDKQEDEADILSSAKAEFNDQVNQEELQAAKLLAAQVRAQTSNEKNISDLCEDDAYNLEVAISAKGMSSPDFLKIVLKDKNYIARWCNRNPIRMSQLVGQGFRMVKEDHVINVSSLDMFLDGQGNFVYADLVAMQIPKNIYYAGLRRAYLKSLHATQNKKASEVGAAFAMSNLQAGLSGSERSYLAEHQEAGSKPIYNPNLGV